MPNSDTMIAFANLVEGFRFQFENRSVVWQLQAMTGNAKQTSGNGTFHGISTPDENIYYK
jgi:hypothetical protein